MWEVRAGSASSLDMEAVVEPVRARCVLATLPLGVLRAGDDAEGAVRFVPEIPEKRAAAAALAMGSVVKIVFRFRRPFWEDVLRFAEGDRPGARELKFLMGDGAFPTWWTSSSRRRRCRRWSSRSS
jgi:hypothetical protein